MLDILTERGAAATDASENLDVFGATLSVLSDGSSVPMVLGKQLVPAGYGVPTHVHDIDDELFLILEGELVLIGLEGETTIGAGSCVQLPRRIPHGFRNASSTPVCMLVALTPGVQGLEMFRHFDRAARGAPLAPETIIRIAAQYGVSFD